MSDRKRSDSSSYSDSTGSPRRKDGGERLIDSSRGCSVVGNTFVSHTTDISPGLVVKVSQKACEFYTTFSDHYTGSVSYHGQGGFIRGEVLETRSKKRTRLNDGDEPGTIVVDFEEDLNYETTPLTAKHNLEKSDEQDYLHTALKLFDGYDFEIVLPDGGCSMTETIVVRPATTTKSEVKWKSEDISFGAAITDPRKILTKDSRLFEKVPDSFKLREGDKIGVVVYRTFDITHKDARAPRNTDLEKVFGQKYQVCIYTGEVTEISDNGRTFCHNINTFKGCSGAIVFLLDKNQPNAVPAEYYGMAVGVSVGGLDVGNNIGFLINK